MKLTRSRAKRFAAAAVSGAAILALAGCVVIIAESDEQLDIIGDVRLTTEICASGSDACPSDFGNSGFPPGSGSTGQVLVGYRIPSGSEPPASFSTASGRAMTFTQNASYTSELQRLAPAPGGQKWIGYLSNVQTYVSNVDASATLRPSFKLMRASDGSPFTGPFLYRTVVGARSTAGSLAADRAVNCGSSLTSYNGGDSTICVDSPDADAIPTNRQRATRDLGVLARSGGRARAGKTASAGFTLRFAGAADPAANFALSASTTVPGGSATPSTGSLQPPSDSSTPVDVRVTVPGATPGGTYEVTLTARLANGQTRSNVERVAVFADTARPAVRVAGVSRACLSSPRRLRIRVRERNLAEVAVTLDGRRITTRTTHSFSVRIDPRRLRRGRHTLRVIALDQAGNRTTVTRTIVRCARRAAPTKPRRLGLTG